MEQQELNSTAAVFEGSTDFNGILNFSKSLVIEGHFEGTIDSTGHLLVAPGAHVHADVKIRSIVIGGVLKGNIEATESVEMLPEGKVYGNIRTNKLKIADGVVFEGQCEMIKDTEKVNIFSVTSPQLKKMIQGAEKK